MNCLFSLQLEGIKKYLNQPILLRKQIRDYTIYFNVQWPENLIYITKKKFHISSLFNQIYNGLSNMRRKNFLQKKNPHKGIQLLLMKFEPYISLRIKNDSPSFLCSIYIGGFYYFDSKSGYIIYVSNNSKKIMFFAGLSYSFVIIMPQKEIIDA